MKLNLKSALPAAAIAFLSYAALATGASASVTSDLNNCRFDSRQKVVDCCEKVLRGEKKPLWMVSTGGNCRTVAKCVGSRADRRSISAAYVSAKRKPRCFISMHLDDGGNGSGVNIRMPDRPQRPQRGGNANF